MDKTPSSDRPRVLLVDDDTELCELVATLLEQNGMDAEACHDGASGLTRACEHEHHIVILDVQLPEMTGLEVLSRLRETSSLPVLMLTARGSDEDRFTGLEQGADDYLPKPFHPRELIARVRAILRRTRRDDPTETSATPPATERVVGELRLHPGRREVEAHGKIIPCTGAEFAILARLMEAPGQAIEREELVEAALGRPYDPRDRSLDVHMSHLRKRLVDGGVRGARIVTVRGAGYLIASSGEAS